MAHGVWSASGMRRDNLSRPSSGMNHSWQHTCGPTRTLAPGHGPRPATCLETSSFIHSATTEAWRLIWPQRWWKSWSGTQPRGSLYSRPPAYGTGLTPCLLTWVVAWVASHGPHNWSIHLVLILDYIWLWLTPSISIYINLTLSCPSRFLQHPLKCLTSLKTGIKPSYIDLDNPAVQNLAEEVSSPPRVTLLLFLEQAISMKAVAFVGTQSRCGEWIRVYICIDLFRECIRILPQLIFSLLSQWAVSTAWCSSMIKDIPCCCLLQFRHMDDDTRAPCWAG